MFEVLAYPTYQPAMRIITSITNTYPAIVTTGDISYPAGVLKITPMDHQYINGMIVRIMVPEIFGMLQMDKLFGEILVIDTHTFSIDIDASLFYPFVVPAVVLVPEPHPGDPGHMVSIPPIRTLSDDTFALEEYAQVVPFAEDNSILTAAVRNVLPYP